MHSSFLTVMYSVTSHFWCLELTALGAQRPSLSLPVYPLLHPFSEHNSSCLKIIIFTICPTPFPLFRWNYSYILFSRLLKSSVILCCLTLCIVPRSFCLSSLAVHFCVCMHDFSFSLRCVLFSCPKNPCLFSHSSSGNTSIRSISGLAGLCVLFVYSVCVHVCG